MRFFRVLILLAVFCIAAQAQYVDRILRPCFAGAVPYNSVVTASSGNVVITTCTGGVVTINGVTVTPGGGGATPGGVNTNVQFNNGGAFGGSTDLAWVAPQLTIGGTQRGQLRLSNAVPTNVILQVPAASFTSWVLTLPVDDGTSGQFLQTNGSGVTTWATAGGGGGSPGGADTNIQFNNAGAFGGSAALVWNGTKESITALDSSFNGVGLAITNTNTDLSGAQHSFGVISVATNAVGGIVGVLSADADGAGFLGVPGVGLTNFSAHPLGFGTAGAERMRITAAGGVNIVNVLGLGDKTTPDAGLARSAAGVVEVNSGTAGTLRDLTARAVVTTTTIQTGVFTVATLPTCNGGAEGTHAGVSDALAPAFLVAVAGGGAVHTSVYCNGTTWVAN